MMAEMTAIDFYTPTITDALQQQSEIKFQPQN